MAARAARPQVVDTAGDYARTHERIRVDVAASSLLRDRSEDGIAIMWGSSGFSTCTTGKAPGRRSGIEAEQAERQVRRSVRSQRTFMPDHACRTSTADCGYTGRCVSGSARERAEPDGTREARGLLTRRRAALSIKSRIPRRAKPGWGGDRAAKLNRSTCAFLNSIYDAAGVGTRRARSHASMPAGKPRVCRCISVAIS